MRHGPIPTFLKLLVTLTAGLSFFRAAPVSGWTITPVNGRDYVPFSEVQSFYGFTFATVSDDSVKLVKPNKILVAKIGARELFMNNLCFYLNLPVIREAGQLMLSRLDLAKIIDPVLRPERVHGTAVRTVVLDPGHGGNDQGTWSSFGTEKYFTLDTINRLAPLLQARGLNVVFTRTTDSYVSLEERVQIANRIPAALFVSVHYNAGAAARGIETYALTPRGVPSSDNKPSLIDFMPCPGNEQDSENITLATATHGCIMGQIRLRDRGIRRARFHVLKGIIMPGILIEGGYLGGEDASTIARAGYRQTIAQSIADGISRYIAAVPDYHFPAMPSTPSSPAPAVNPLAEETPEKPTLPKAPGLVQSAPAPISADVNPH